MDKGPRGMRGHDWSRWIHLIRTRQPIRYPVHHYFYHYTTRAYEFIVRWSDGRDVDRLVEVGCGSCLAPISVKLSQPWKEIVACDVSKEVVNFALQRCRHWRVEVSLVVCDARWLPFRRGSFHSALSEGLLEHWDEPDRVRMVREMGRVADRVVVDLPINQRDPGVESGYGDEFLSGTTKYWTRLFEGTGMEVVEEYVRERRADGTIVRAGWVLRAP